MVNHLGNSKFCIAVRPLTMTAGIPAYFTIAQMGIIAQNTVKGISSLVTDFTVYVYKSSSKVSLRKHMNEDITLIQSRVFDGNHLQWCQASNMQQLKKTVNSTDVLLLLLLSLPLLLLLTTSVVIFIITRNTVI